MKRLILSIIYIRYIYIEESYSCAITPCTSSYDNFIYMLAHPAVIPFYIVSLAFVFLIIEKIYLSKKIKIDSFSPQRNEIFKEVILNLALYTATIFLLVMIIDTTKRPLISPLAIWGINISLVLSVISILYSSYRIKVAFLKKNNNQEISSTIKRIGAAFYVYFLMASFATIYVVDDHYFANHKLKKSNSVIYDRIRIFNFINKY